MNQNTNPSTDFLMAMMTTCQWRVFALYWPELTLAFQSPECEALFLLEADLPWDVLKDRLYFAHPEEAEQGFKNVSASAFQTPILDGALEIKAKYAQFDGQAYVICQCEPTQQSYVPAELERLKSALKTGRLGVWEWDVRLKQLHLSSEFKQLLGYRFFDMRNTFEDWGMVMTPESWQQFSEDLEQLQNQEQSTLNEIYEHVHVSGRSVFIRNQAEAVYTSDGKLLKVFGLLDDVSAQVYKTRDLESTKQEAEQAAVAKSQFLSTMSHEIRTPLNAIIGMSRILLEEEPRKDQERYLKALNYASENLLYLLNDILDLSKLEAQQVTLEKSPFRLTEMIEGLKSLFETKAKEKGLEFKIRKETSIPEVLVGDSLRLSQILINLINNALKFTSEGSVTLDILSQDESAESVCLYFRVVDTGIGIPKDKQEAIFQEFSQAESDTTRRYGGTGLGLAIVQKLLALQNSQAYVDSLPGQGSTFYFSLTFEKGTEQVTDANVLKASADLQVLKGKRILLAEDNAINQFVVLRSLKEWGVIVDVVSDGAQAALKAQENTYDLILMDLQMPEMDGFEATQILRKQQIKTPIIALTASAMLDVQSDILDQGLNGYVTKPFVPQRLFDVVAEHILNVEHEVKNSDE